MVVPSSKGITGETEGLFNVSQFSRKEMLAGNLSCQPTFWLLYNRISCLSSKIHGSGGWLDQSSHDSHQSGLTRCSWTNQQVNSAIEGRREVVNDVF